MFGLQFFNENTGELILSDNGIVYSYIGQATNTALTQGVKTGSNRSSGFSTYQINYDGDIIVILPLKAGLRTATRLISRSGNTHTIRVSNSVPDANSANTGYGEQFITEVYVFGMPNVVSGGTYGAALYNDNGTLIADLTRYPMTFRMRLYSPDGQSPITLPAGLTKPAFLGMPNSTKELTMAAREYDYSNCWEVSADGTQVYPAFYHDSDVVFETNPRPERIIYRPAVGLLLDLANI